MYIPIISITAVQKDFVRMIDISYSQKCFDVSEIFNHRYTEEWKVNKKFQTRALRNAGFGSKLVEPTFQRDLDQLYALVDAQKEKPIDVRKPLQCLLGSTMATVVYGAQYNLSDEELQDLIQYALEWMAAAYTGGMSLGYWMDNVPSWITKLLFPKMAKEAYNVTFEFQNFLIKKVTTLSNVKMFILARIWDQPNRAKNTWVGLIFSRRISH